VSAPSPGQSSPDIESAPLVAVAGATGRVGAAVVDRLVELGLPVRALARRPEALTLPDGVEAVAADYQDAEGLTKALRGAERVFLVTPDHKPDDQPVLERAFAAAAAEAGVKHIVKLSACLAGATPPVSFGIAQRAAERAVEASGLAFTHLRPTFYLQSLTLFADDVRAGKLIVPVREGRVSFVDLNDVAAVAAGVLAAGGFEGEAIDVTGPEALSFSDVAAALSAALASPVRHQPIPPFAARLVLPMKAKMSFAYAGLVVDMMRAIENGAEAHVSDAVERIAGRPPKTLGAYLEENLDVFR